MAEELGRIEKPTVESFGSNRRIFYVPLIIALKDLPLEYTVKYNHYWEQVDTQLSGLEAKLGKIKHIYHELITEGGEKGVKALQELNSGATWVIQNRIEKGAVLEVVEDNDVLAELIDWGHCLALGLQSQKVISTIYQSYAEAKQKRDSGIIKRISETLKDGECGVLIMGEEFHIQLPQDIQVFYVSPPGLDEIKRWLRDYEEQIRNRPDNPDSANKDTGSRK